MITVINYKKENEYSVQNASMNAMEIMTFMKTKHHTHTNSLFPDIIFQLYNLTTTVSRDPVTKTSGAGWPNVYCAIYFTVNRTAKLFNKN